MELARFGILLYGPVADMFRVSRMTPWHRLLGLVMIDPHRHWQKTAHQGIYEIIWGIRTIKVVVCRGVAMLPRNALWLLFSGDEKRVTFAMRHFGLNNHDMSTIISRISETYRIGGLSMPYTLEDFKRECLEESIKKIKDLPEDEKQKILAGLEPKDRLAGLSQKEIEELRKLIN